MGSVVRNTAVDTQGTNYKEHSLPSSVVFGD